MPEDSQIYSKEFFQKQAQGSLKSGRRAFEILLKKFEPSSMIDVGCGVGPWSKAAKELGINSVFGIDGKYIDDEMLLIDRSNFLAADLNEPIRMNSKFDIAVCVELAEHLPPQRAKSLIEDLTLLSEVIVFSAAVRFQGGDGHLNEQWPEYWAGIFEEYDYIPYDLFRRKLWATQCEPWYSQNLFLFIKKGNQLGKILRNYSMTGKPLTIIHPEIFLINCSRYRLGMAEALIDELDMLKNLQGTYVARKSHLRKTQLKNLIECFNYRAASFFKY